MEQGLSYDDVLLKPQKSSVTSLSNVEVSAELAGLELGVPCISAPMDTVTEAELATEMAQLGGIGIIHRFMPEKQQMKQVAEVKSCDAGDEAATCPNGNLLVGAAVGLNDFGRAEKLVKAGCDMLVVDIAHGHHDSMMEEIQKYSEEFPDAALVAGNVATVEGARDLEEAGADIVKVGIGPGSACTTREMTGVGVPQFTAVKKCAEAVDVPVIADGGIRKPGDLAKALMAGASAGMMGGMFAGTREAPGELVEIEGEKYKKFRGMSSREAAEKRAEREGRDLSYSETFSEGVATKIEYEGELETIVHDLAGGLRSSVSYCGANNLQDAKRNAEFVKVTGSTQARNGAHI